MDFSFSFALCCLCLVFPSTAFGFSSTGALGGNYPGLDRRCIALLSRKKSGFLKTCTTLIGMTTQAEFPGRQAPDHLTENFLQNPWVDPPVDASARVQVDRSFCIQSMNLVRFLFLSPNYAVSLRKSLHIWKKNLLVYSDCPWIMRSLFFFNFKNEGDSHGHSARRWEEADGPGGDAGSSGGAGYS